MRVHTDGPVCAGCEKKLMQADPRIAKWFRERVKPLKPDCHISWSFRGKEDQEEAVREGKSEKPWPSSAHNAIQNGKPCSRALDLFQSVDGKALFPMRYFREICDDADAAGVPIRWGGRFRSLGDACHFEWNESNLRIKENSNGQDQKSDQEERQES